MLLAVRIRILVVLQGLSFQKPLWDLANGTWNRLMMTTTGFKQVVYFARQLISAWKAKSVA